MKHAASVHVRCVATSRALVSKARVCAVAATGFGCTTLRQIRWRLTGLGGARVYGIRGEMMDDLWDYLVLFCLSVGALIATSVVLFICAAVPLSILYAVIYIVSAAWSAGVG